MQMHYIGMCDDARSAMAKTAEILEIPRPSSPRPDDRAAAIRKMLALGKRDQVVFGAR